MKNDGILYHGCTTIITKKNISISKSFVQSLNEILCQTFDNKYRALKTNQYISFFIEIKYQKYFNDIYDYCNMLLFKYHYLTFCHIRLLLKLK